MKDFDFIIVGAGSAGCVLADRLTADGKSSVLLLEAGGSDRRFWIRTPIGYGKTYYDERVNWKYMSDPSPGLGGRTSYVPRGKVLGGSSSINAMVYCRGLSADYDDWEAAGNPGWGWRDVEPLFGAFERKIDGDGRATGNGNLWVSHREADCHPVKRHFYDAARELQFDVIDDLNAPDAEGIAAYHVNTRRGMRCSSADAFLRPAMRRRNLVVATSALVEQITFSGRRATGVRYRIGGNLAEASARREVIVSGGAINSPKLLQASGIGPGALLQGLGIGVVHANDGVGGHLQDHLGINYVYRAREPTLNAVLGTWRGRIAAGLRYLTSRSGPLSLSVNQIGGIVRSHRGLPRPDVQLYFNPLSYSTEYVGKRPLMKPDPWPGFIIGFNSCRPTSTGRVDISSSEPSAAPRIQPNYLSTNRDIEDVVAGARLIGRLERTVAMRRLIDGQLAIDLAGSSDEAIVADFRARSGSVYHPCGTCRMAPEADGGVVDPALRVHGVDGLRVVDASIFPNITSANTNGPAILVAHKAAQLILGH